jgi:hypothetical protein
MVIVDEFDIIKVDVVELNPKFIPILIPFNVSFIVVAE